MKYSEYRERQKFTASEKVSHAKAQSQKDMLFYTEGLMSLECLCGREKLKGNSFCLSCYRALPVEMRKALYRSLGHGYEEAYEDSVKWLQQNKW
jgi:hypothetical protein